MGEPSLSSKLSGLERSHSAESSMSTRNPDRRKQLVAGLLRQMQRQYGSDAVRTRLIEGELQAAPELRGGKITPGGLKAVETRVAASMKDVATGVGADSHIILPAVKKDRQRPLSANFNADLRDMASWTEVNKYRSDFFAYELQKEGKARQVALKKTQDELAHQLREGQARKAALKDKVRREADEEAARRATYLADKAAEDAKMANKARMEQEMRSNQTNERRARRAVEQRLKDLEDGETLRLHEESVQEAKAAYERKVLADEANNKMFVEEVGRHRDYREKKRLEADADQLRLNAQWKDILDQQEFRRAEQYRLLRDKGQRAMKSFEDNAGAVDAAREKKEDENRVRWHKQFEKETMEKDAARAAYRSKMERECQEGCMLQINTHNAARVEAKAAALKLKLAMIEQAKEEKEERRREKEEEMARAMRYRAVLAGQIKDIQNGRAAAWSSGRVGWPLKEGHLPAQGDPLGPEGEPSFRACRGEVAAALWGLSKVAHSTAFGHSGAGDPGSHVMTPIEASLNRPLLVSMKERKFEGFSSTLG